MTLARAPLASDAFLSAGNYRFWTPTGWSTRPAAAGNIFTGDSTYTGTWNSELDVAQLDNGEFVMVYSPPGMDDAAVARTAATPWGPWSRPALFGIPGYTIGVDYQLVVHPELDTPGSLVLSYAAKDLSIDGSMWPQLEFAGLPMSGLPAEPPLPLKTLAALPSTFTLTGGVTTPTK